MRIAIYNRFLTTLGGGERYMLTIAEILGRYADVDVLSQRVVPPDIIKARLGIDIGGVNMVRLSDDSRETVEAASSRYDLFINCSHLDPVMSQAPLSILLVYFPSATSTGWRAVVRQSIEHFVRPLLWLPVLEAGFGHEERSGGEVFRWTNGEGRVLVPATGLARPRLVVPLASFRHDNTGPLVRFVSGDEEVGVADVPSGSDFHAFSVAPAAQPDGSFSLSIRSDTFVPASKIDTRRLGVAVGTIRPAGWRGWVSQRTVERLALRPGEQLHDRYCGRTPAYVSSYDSVWTISRFARRWTERYWGVRSSLINPPVDVEAIQALGFAPKENLILNVGRFFEGHHNKKHLEMIRAFRDMVEAGLRGWSLVLVGGSSDEPVHKDYLRRVRAEAEGLPVRIAIDVPYAELLDLYSRASVYWHATGLGAERRDPAAMEHFGITTVEAMAAGCVPIVIRRAGQCEIVSHQVNGLLWRDLEGLKSAMWSIVRDPERCAALSAAARRRSLEFGHAAFERRLLELVEAVAPLPRREQVRTAS